MGLKRGRLQGSLQHFLRLAALWAILAIIVIEMVRLVFTPSSIDGVMLVLGIIVLLDMLK